MNTHPYLRAYVAGIFGPTLVLPIVLSVFIVLRIAMRYPIPIEQALIFPMAVVPSLFGLWNMLWLGSHGRTGAPIGLHGALLPVLMAPTGASVAVALGVLQFQATGVVWFQALNVSYTLIAPCFVAALVIYYLVWKYIVGTINRILGIA
jgi:hypothetical protein